LRIEERPLIWRVAANKLNKQSWTADKGFEKNEMGWACGSYGGGEGAYRVLVGKPEGKNRWGDLGIDGWIILGWISRRLVVGMGTGLG
jgi:hypothetical protein